MISIVFPHLPSPEQDKILELNKRMLAQNTECEYELLTVVGGDRHIVYPAFNFLISQAKYPIVVMANTDVVFAPGWDRLLRQYIEHGDWFSFRLVECGAIGTHWANVNRDFGMTADTFREQEFYDFMEQEKAKCPEIEDGFIWYVPCAWKKEYFLNMGGFDTHEPFPTPNDIRFREKCEAAGARFKILNSWAYHFQRAEINRGEKPERV